METQIVMVSLSSIVSFVTSDGESILQGMQNTRSFVMLLLGFYLWLWHN